MNNVQTMSASDQGINPVNVVLEATDESTSGGGWGSALEAFSELAKDQGMTVEAVAQVMASSTPGGGTPPPAPTGGPGGGAPAGAPAGAPPPAAPPGAPAAPAGAAPAGPTAAPQQSSSAWTWYKRAFLAQLAWVELKHLATRGYTFGRQTLKTARNTAVTPFKTVGGWMGSGISGTWNWFEAPKKPSTSGKGKLGKLASNAWYWSKRGLKGAVAGTAAATIGLGAGAIGSVEALVLTPAAFLGYKHGDTEVIGSKLKGGVTAKDVEKAAKSILGEEEQKALAEAMKGKSPDEALNTASTLLANTGKDPMEIFKNAGIFDSEKSQARWWRRFHRAPDSGLISMGSTFARGTAYGLAGASIDSLSLPTARWAVGKVTGRGGELQVSDAQQLAAAWAGANPHIEDYLDSSTETGWRRYAGAITAAPKKELAALAIAGAETLNIGKITGLGQGAQVAVPFLAEAAARRMHPDRKFAGTTLKYEKIANRLSGMGDRELAHFVGNFKVEEFTGGVLSERDFRDFLGAQALVQRQMRPVLKRQIKALYGGTDQDVIRLANTSLLSAIPRIRAVGGDRADFLADKLDWLVRVTTHNYDDIFPRTP